METSILFVKVYISLMWHNTCRTPADRGLGGSWGTKQHWRYLKRKPTIFTILIIKPCNLSINKIANNSYLNSVPGLDGNSLSNLESDQVKISAFFSFSSQNFLNQQVTIFTLQDLLSIGEECEDWPVQKVWHPFLKFVFLWGFASADSVTPFFFF